MSPAASGDRQLVPERAHATQDDMIALLNRLIGHFPSGEVAFNLTREPEVAQFPTPLRLFTELSAHSTAWSRRGTTVLHDRFEPVGEAQRPRRAGSDAWPPRWPPRSRP